MLKDLAIIGTDECRELFDGILGETEENTGHLLGKEHFFKYSQRKKLEQRSFPSKQIEWIVNDIFGNHSFKKRKD